MTQDVFVSYAQNREDVMLWRALARVGPGFYIDAGAADPARLSVTRAFYDRGWHGLDIEPLPEQAARLRAARPRDVVIEAALGDTAGEAMFYRVRHEGDLGLSTLDPAAAGLPGDQVEALRVPVTTLAALCRAHVQGPVHFLKIDVEGAEQAALAGADFTSVRPWIVLVEATRPLTQEPTQHDWEPYLLGAGYVFVWFDGLNRFYVAAERHDALAHHFQAPPNVFDRYTVADPAMEELLAATRALAEARLAVIERLQAEAPQAAEAPKPLPAPPPPPQQDPPRRTLAGRYPALRKAFLWAYGLVRPVARPLAWRSRSFLTATLMAEIAALRARQETMLARLDHVHRPAPTPDTDPSLTGERLLLTLALEHRREP